MVLKISFLKLYMHSFLCPFCPLSLKEKQMLMSPLSLIFFSWSFFLISLHLTTWVPPYFIFALIDQINIISGYAPNVTVFIHHYGLFVFKYRKYPPSPRLKFTEMLLFLKVIFSMIMWSYLPSLFDWFSP